TRRILPLTVFDHEHDQDGREMAARWTLVEAALGSATFPRARSRPAMRRMRPGACRHVHRIATTRGHKRYRVWHAACSVGSAGGVPMLPMGETLIPHGATILIVFGQGLTVLAVGLAASVAGLVAGTACAAIGARAPDRLAGAPRGGPESATPAA
ncbi:MAG TPA: hypothetical protein VFG86_09625, partial [Chloroflexota bacterium]|nr:hypothetical protein [Chloroflexota bacterium]